MKTYEEIKNTIGTFKSNDKVRESYIKTTNQRLIVATYEELFKAIQNKDRKACLNYEYSLTKTEDTDLSEARVFDTSDNKSLLQLYSKHAGKNYDVVLSKIEKYHDAFIKALSPLGEMKDGKVFKCYTTYENLPEVVRRAHIVLACKGIIEDVEKALSPKNTKK